MEITFLAERGRLPASALGKLEAALKDPTSSVIVAPLDIGVADALRTIPRHAVPEMPDRIIAATAFHLDAALVTRDRRLHSASATRALGVRVVW